LNEQPVRIFADRLGRLGLGGESGPASSVLNNATGIFTKRHDRFPVVMLPTNSAPGSPRATPAVNEQRAGSRRLRRRSLENARLIGQGCPVKSGLAQHQRGGLQLAVDDTGQAGVWRVGLEASSSALVPARHEGGGRDCFATRVGRSLNITTDGLMFCRVSVLPSN